MLAQWDPYNIPILSEKKGVIAFEDMLPGVTTKVERDASGGRSMVVIEHKEDLNPQIIVQDTSGNSLATYSVPTGAQVAVDEGTRIDAGSIIAKTPRQASKTQDITGGLPRVAELFEARRPKEGNVGQMAKIDGIVTEAGTLRSKKRLLVTNEESGQVEEHLIPHGKHVLVQPGDFAQKGQLITEGAKDPHEILEILEAIRCAEYLIEEIQKVYRLQGVTINDKHLEVIISACSLKLELRTQVIRISSGVTKWTALRSWIPTKRFPRRAVNPLKASRFFWVLPRHLSKPIVSSQLHLSRKPRVF